MKKKQTRKKKADHWQWKKILIWVSGLMSVFAIATSIIIFHSHPICANSISCIKDLSGKVQPSETQGSFLGHSVSVPQNLTEELTSPLPPVLGAQTAGDKHIYVDLSTQRLFASENNKIVYEFPISSGKWHPTPTGIFRIWIKLYATRMTGGEGADYYDLPNVPWVMFFYGDGISKADGFSIHGAYWHNNFGHPMSHGCVNMRIEDAKTLFEWATPSITGPSTYATEENPGTLVTIYGTAPDQ